MRPEKSINEMLSTWKRSVEPSKWFTILASLADLAY